MIVVTGGAGFIGSVVARRLNEQGRDDLLIVDELGKDQKWKNLVKLRYHNYLHKDEFLSLLLDGGLPNVEAIIHMGACSATTERDADYLMQNNFQYTQALALYSLQNNLRFIYASSAATYGSGDAGYSDDAKSLERLRPLNMYGYSKHAFDLWADTTQTLDKIVGLKFFNVFGPNEYHKDSMASVVFKAFKQLEAGGEIRLFKSDRPTIGDGEQKRDFVYVKDCVDVILYFLENKSANGLFNLGTGKARSFKDLALAVYQAMEKQPNIEYFAMPKELEGKYQYFTEANMDKLRGVGYNKEFTELEVAVKDYVCGYLAAEDSYF